ncbi:hypothetical protein GKG47_20170 [Lactonifactor sp. BIOML-A3]|uniref:hypothetical protein n=1 Tax=unclassified Lactonifactor TaxID=2636670 RepID=UPI0012B0EC62|nr:MULTISPECIES: hypothetical protein [unclassified Lactonifactor]MSA03723.1 hypothetical protein [Lactonifactor sp. BIOML-A5]MSA10180.1 hypothetical protein [Lactonifactor sp. BIOML-A4]MSA14730.1 hypothetical protein [Lactonifactor sp. BIOML-A3]MSA19152.1 hypothetical protein [Lactonifactor sp. BIOML-A2]MSA39826.1 hypothetical protein [Lactonifactor sp. BIOML-A1]
MYKISLITNDMSFLVEFAHDTGGTIGLSDDGSIYYLFYADYEQFLQARGQLHSYIKGGDILV